VAPLAPSGGYGRKIIPLLKVNTATTKTTISAGTIFNTFIGRPYRRAEILSVLNWTIPSHCEFQSQIKVRQPIRTL
jgi:hypothetical protein